MMNLQYRLEKYRSNWLNLNNSFINNLITKGELDEGNVLLKDEVRLIIREQSANHEIQNN